MSQGVQQEWGMVVKLLSCTCVLLLWVVQTWVICLGFDKWDSEQVRYCFQLTLSSDPNICDVFCAISLSLSLSLFVSLYLPTPSACPPHSPVMQPAAEKFLCLVYWIFRPSGTFWQTLILVSLCSSLPHSLAFEQEAWGRSAGAVRTHWASCLTRPYDAWLRHFPSLSSPSPSSFFLHSTCTARLLSS